MVIIAVAHGQVANLFGTTIREDACRISNETVKGYFISENFKKDRFYYKYTVTTDDDSSGGVLPNPAVLHGIVKTTIVLKNL